MHLNEGPERELEPPKECEECEECGGSSDYLAIGLCPDCFNIAKSDYDKEVQNRILKWTYLLADE